MGILYLVATPIGNLEDISLRALNILRSSRLIAAEDTRVTRRLLSAYDIHTPLTSYFEHNKLAKLDRILANLEEGAVALVSDAGTPGLNDPGYELVRAALAAGHTVVPIPGPSAPTAALVASGLPTNSFLYLGYLPRKASERRHVLESIASLPFTLIFLEAPHRLVDCTKRPLGSPGELGCCGCPRVNQASRRDIPRYSRRGVRAFLGQSSPGGDHPGGPWKPAREGSLVRSRARPGDTGSSGAGPLCPFCFSKYLGTIRLAS